MMGPLTDEAMASMAKRAEVYGQAMESMVERAEVYGQGSRPPFAHYAHDVPRLIAEVNRLRHHVAAAEHHIEAMKRREQRTL